MLIILIRTFILYVTVLFVLRVMGKGELSKMDPFQMVILFMIAELASLPIEAPDVSILTGISALIALMFLQVLISVISLKSEKFKHFINGKPSVLIDRGAIDVKEMKRLRISIDDLSQQLRLKNYPSVADLDYAILEVNGDLSVIPTPEKRALNPSDLSLTPGREFLPVILVSDGKLFKQNLAKTAIAEELLRSQLLTLNITDYSQIFLCFADEKQKIHVYPKQGADCRKVSDLTSPGGSIPASAAPVSAMPDPAAPVSVMPDSASPGNIMSASAAPGSSMPDLAAPGKAAPDFPHTKGEKR